MKRIIEKFWYLCLSPLGFLGNVDGSISFLQRFNIKIENMHNIFLVIQSILSFAIFPVVAYLLIHHIRISSKQKDEISLLKASISLLVDISEGNKQGNQRNNDGTMSGAVIDDKVRFYNNIGNRINKYWQNEKLKPEIELKTNNFINEIKI